MYYCVVVAAVVIMLMMSLVTPLSLSSAQAYVRDTDLPLKYSI